MAGGVIHEFWFKQGSMFGLLMLWRHIGSLRINLKKTTEGNTTMTTGIGTISTSSFFTIGYRRYIDD